MDLVAALVCASCAMWHAEFVPLHAVKKIKWRPLAQSVVAKVLTLSEQLRKKLDLRFTR